MFGQHLLVHRRRFGKRDDDVYRASVCHPIHRYRDEPRAVPLQQLDGRFDRRVNFRIHDVGIEEVVFGDADAQAVDSPIEPERQDRLELVVNARVAPVEVGLLRQEQMQVVAT